MCLKVEHHGERNGERITHGEKKTCEKKNNTYEQIGTSFSQMDNITIEK